MRILIADDDFMARRILKELLSPLGDCDIVVNGGEAIQAFRLSLEDKDPYTLICMDIMMPEVDGHQAIEQIRAIEEELDVPESKGVKIIMISALDDPRNVMRAYGKGGATAYLVKPIEKNKLLHEIDLLGLLDSGR